MNKKEKQEEYERCFNQLKYFIKPNDTVYTFLKSVSSNGMSRQIAVLVPFLGTIKNISWEVSKVLELRLNKSSDAVVIGGAGMDMGYHIVHSLSRVLFPDFYCSGDETCHSNDHTNDRDGSWERSKNKGRKHSDGGYALQHTWL